MPERKVNLENKSLEQERYFWKVIIQVWKKIFDIVKRPIEKIQEFWDKQIKN